MAYTFTIRENVLLFSNDENAYKQLNDLCEMFGLKSKIDDLKSKFDTGIKAEYYDDYTDFSGGEYQKLAIIRTFCKESSMLILDEPLNNIDLKTESIFYRLIGEEKQKLIILVSHSLKYAPQVDKILYMENGSVLVCDSHNNLLKQNIKYRDMYNEYTSKYL